MLDLLLLLLLFLFSYYFIQHLNSTTSSICSSIIVIIIIYIYIYIKPKLLKLPQFSTSTQYLKNKIKNNCTRKPNTILKKKKKNLNTHTQGNPKTKNPSFVSTPTLAAYPSPLSPLPSKTISSQQR